ncbi:hypothetical protein D3C76_841030 [compost metagenome]
MDTAIQKISIHGNDVWQVEAYGVTVAFHELPQAMDFLAKLQCHIEAPHFIPEKATQRWRSEHAKGVLNKKP